VGVDGTCAAMLRMHETVRRGAVFSMREVSHLVAPPHARLEFRPGGDHVMLTGLRATLEAGARVPLALRLRDGRVLPVVASVRS